MLLGIPEQDQEAIRVRLDVGLHLNDDGAARLPGDQLSRSAAFAGLPKLPLGPLGSNAEGTGRSQG